MKNSANCILSTTMIIHPFQWWWFDFSLWKDKCFCLWSCNRV